MPDTIPATCPVCGHEAGLHMVPREAQTELTSIRCLRCRTDAPARDWYTDRIDDGTVSLVRTTRQR